MAVEEENRFIRANSVNEANSNRKRSIIAEMEVVVEWWLWGRRYPQEEEKEEEESLFRRRRRRRRRKLYSKLTQ